MQDGAAILDRRRPVFILQQIGLDELERGHIGMLRKRGADGVACAGRAYGAAHPVTGVQELERAMLGDEAGDPGYEDSFRRHCRCVSRGHGLKSVYCPRVATLLLVCP